MSRWFAVFFMATLSLPSLVFAGVCSGRVHQVSWVQATYIKGALHYNVVFCGLPPASPQFNQCPELATGWKQAGTGLGYRCDNDKNSCQFDKAKNDDPSACQLP